MQIIKVFKVFTLPVLVASSLLACSSGSHRVSSNQVSYEPTFTQRKGVDDAKTIQLATALENLGITVLSAGQEHSVVVPVGRLFNYQSPNFASGAYSTMNVVIAYIKQFRTGSIRVGASSRAHDLNVAKALSTDRARAVSKYLWRQGVDTRVLYNEPKGERAPVIRYEGKGVTPIEEAYVIFVFRNLIL